MCGLGTIWRIWGGGAGDWGLAGLRWPRPLGVKKPGPWPGLLLAAAGSVLDVLIDEAELGSLIENVECGLQLLDVGTLPSCAADLLA